MVELIYALHSVGAINKGGVAIRDVANVFEAMFNIKLGDYYRTYLEIRNRTSSQTKFLDKMIEALEAKFNESDSYQSN